MPERRLSHLSPSQSDQSTNSGATHPEDTGDIVFDADSLPRQFGRYQIREVLGRGGMGSVCLALDTQLDRLVALKIPNFDGIGSAGGRARFLTEARAAATLTHPNICPVFDVGEIEEIPYISMAYIEGETLASSLSQKGQYEIEDAVAIVSTLAHAMSEAHRKGIVHRDLKPANVMLDSAGRPLITDFGLAILPSSSDDLRLTLTGVALGTPSYMPPEQAGGDAEAIGPPSDVYSLGIILYELVTGRVPFKARTFGQLLAQIERDSPPRPSTLNPNVDKALEALIMTSLAKEPGDRFANAGEMAEAMVRYRDGDIDAITAEFGGQCATTSKWESAMPTPDKAHTSWSMSKWNLLVAACLLVAAGITIYINTDSGQLVVQLSAPAADVDVRVNDQDVTPAVKDGKPVHVRANKEHLLEIRSQDYETVVKSFDLKRGGVHVANIKLIPRAKDSQQSLPREERAVASTTRSDLVTSIPTQTSTPKPVEYPEEPVTVKAPGWELLIDAPKDSMDKWLDERKADHHSVMWLDAFEVNQRPVYSAIAALDDRAADWTAITDLDIYQMDPKKLTSRVDITRNCIQSMGGFLVGLAPHYCLLFHPGEQFWTVGPAYDSTALSEFASTSAAKGMQISYLRDFTARGIIFHSAVFKTGGSKQPRFRHDMTSDELTQFLGGNRELTPQVVSAVARNGELSFSALLCRDSTATEWNVDTNLTGSMLKKRFADQRVNGFQLRSVTGYPWDGNSRYVCIWTKPE